MASATDLITYIGVPLAVIGVIPTIFTCAKSLVTLRSIRRLLDDNGTPAITRSTLLSGIVEVEIPRKSIIPLDRADPAYFELNPCPSRLRGGSWTILNWKELIIGVKAYRVQYHDELSQPQAEVGFEALLAFLLDRGAVPSVAGFSDLRSSGLWTPAGTKLLLSPVTADPVLTVATASDSDGILSLCLDWRHEWDRRTWESLPPYWIRLTSSHEAAQIRAAIKGIQPDASKPEPADPSTTTTFSPDRRPSATDMLSTLHDSLTSFRLRIGSSGVEESYREDDPKHRLALPHLQSHLPSDTRPMWFSVGCTALGAPRGGLWSYAIPDDITQLARRETVPCGVMVLLGLLDDDAVPAWRTPYDDALERLKQQTKLMDRARQMSAENQLSPAEKVRAQQARVSKEAWEFHNEMRERQIERERRVEQELTEALTSQRLAIGPVAEACRAWLVREGHVPGAEAETGFAAIVEQVLYCMITSEGVGWKMAGMLDRWRSWAESGGMARPTYRAVAEDVVVFGFAACVLWVVREAAMHEAGAVVSDLQECVRIWRKVRLG
ncbi:hypothetical protein EJ05DRAFT_482176 [Pseudovirgaria hyperparasitica]|uniref:Uncharacterized protein n=1 Tax=Pseudovirgaria hyperparasitica TaxID=470096 RepID=A0A6A6WMC0_9PEZI|nr:uncharacterized protein EJ05DRAFT_482176 [Pseudovirgaria hyperparasitica]KAF2763367.1 hypothetical protein EJ05DRAFT_482176 [Pseudovirgaria hyperparasitica]